MVAEADQVKKAIMLYRESNSNGYVPYATNANNGVLYREDTDQYKEGLGKLVPTYLAELPTSPDGESYSYAVSSDGKSAVFSANLKTSRSGGSSNNSCDLVETSTDVEYNNCNAVLYGTWGEPYWDEESQTVKTDYYPPSCSDVEYDEQTEECFEVTSSTLNYNCSCSPYPELPYSKNNSFPDFFCEENYTRTYYGSCSFYPKGGDNATVCTKSGEGAICDGTADDEYCACIE
jgi:hypothetical protein